MYLYIKEIVMYLLRIWYIVVILYVFRIWDRIRRLFFEDEKNIVIEWVVVDIYGKIFCIFKIKLLFFKCNGWNFLDNVMEIFDFELF